MSSTLASDPAFLSSLTDLTPQSTSACPPSRTAKPKPRVEGAMAKIRTCFGFVGWIIGEKLIWIGEQPLLRGSCVCGLPADWVSRELPYGLALWPEPQRPVPLFDKCRRKVHGLASERSPRKPMPSRDLAREEISHAGTPW